MGRPTRVSEMPGRFSNPVFFTARDRVDVGAPDVGTFRLKAQRTLPEQGKLGREQRRLAGAEDPFHVYATARQPARSKSMFIEIVASSTTVAE